VFLQFLYELNVICYIEKDATNDAEQERFIRWCFRERTLSNMAPKVRVGVEYEIFYGLSKALNVGRSVKVQRRQSERKIGSIVGVDVEKGFGFIRGGNQQAEYYFKVSDFRANRARSPRLGEKVSFEVQIKYGKLRAVAITPA